MGRPKRGNEILGRYLRGYSIVETNPNTENPRDAINNQGNKGISSQLWPRRIRNPLVSDMSQI